MPNSAIDIQNAQLPTTPREYVKYLLKNRGVSVQKMCDDTRLSKSTMDKWLAGQTVDTSFGNVVAAVSYLGGSLDHLAKIQSESPSPAPDPKSNPKNGQEDYPALALLVNSYEKEIHRINDQHQLEIQRVESIHSKYLTHVVELVETGRQALITQHTSAIGHFETLTNITINEKQKHLDSFRKGRDVWRTVSFVCFGLLAAALVYVVWELSNLPLGLTGHLLRSAGLMP